MGIGGDDVSVSNNLDDRELVQIQHYVLGCAQWGTPHILKIGFELMPHRPVRTTTKLTQIKLVLYGEKYDIFADIWKRNLNSVAVSSLPLE